MHKIHSELQDPQGATSPTGSHKTHRETQDARSLNLQPQDIQDPGGQTHSSQTYEGTIARSTMA